MHIPLHRGVGRPPGPLPARGEGSEADHRQPMHDPDESDPESRHGYLDRIVREAPTRTRGAFYGSTRRSDAVRTDGGPGTGPQASPAERRRWHAARAAAKRLQHTAPREAREARTDGAGSIRGLEDGHDLVEWADQRLQDALEDAENAEARFAVREARQALIGELFDAQGRP